VIPLRRSNPSNLTGLFRQLADTRADVPLLSNCWPSPPPIQRQLPDSRGGGGARRLGNARSFGSADPEMAHSFALVSSADGMQPDAGCSHCVGL